MAEYIVEYLDEEDTCKNCFHKEACDAWVRHGATLYDDYHYSVEGCPFHTPAADVEEVKHGHWVLGHVEPGYFTPGGNRPWVCSECGQVVSWWLDKPKENFCPNCGAKMNGGEENEPV